MPELRDPAAPHSLRDEVLQVWERGGLSLSDVTGDRQVQTIYRELGRRSLYFLAKAVLQYSKLTKVSHKPVADFIQDPSRKRGLVLLPRDVYKTTIGVVSYCIWLLINDPNTTILIANQIRGHAERMLLEIEQHLGGSNVLMNLFWPEMIKPNDRYKPWSQEEMTIPNRTVIRSTPSIITIGVGSRAESIHTDIQINDDLVGIEDMFSDINMQAALTWHDYERNLATDPNNVFERMYGTRWPGKDIYGDLIKSGKYDVYWKPAWDEERDILYFPTIYNRDTLREIRDRNPLMYKANILNKEVHPGSLEFKANQLNYFRLLDDPENGLICRVGNTAPFEDYLVSKGDVIIIIDTAASGDEQQSDRNEIKRQRVQLSNNAILVLMAQAERFWQLESWAGRAEGKNPELQIAAKLLEICVNWQGYFRDIYIEAFGAHASFITIFNMVCRQAGYSFTIKPLPKGTKKSKDVRIRTAIGPVAQNGQLMVRQNQDQFINEFISFPSGMKDCLDCLTWGIDQSRMPLSEVNLFKERRVLQERSQRRMRFIGRAGY